MATQKDWFLQTILNFLFFSLTFEGARPEDKKPTIDIYYSVTNPTSLKFLKNEVKTITNQTLTQHVNITLFPFGGCKLNEVNKKLQCDSGQEQVQASLRHLCAIHIFNNLKGPTLAFSADALTYVICAMEKMIKSSQQLDSKECTDMNAKGLTDRIEECIEKKGDELVMKHIGGTRGMNYTNYSVIVIVNGKRNTEKSLQGRNFLVQLVCAAAGPQSLPEMCKNFKKNVRTSSKGCWGTSPFAPIFYLTILLFY